MTNESGASDHRQAAIGFGSGIREGELHEPLNRMFTPEIP